MTEFRFNLALLFFTLWTVTQAIMAMQFLPFNLMSGIESLKSIMPAVFITVSGFLYVNKLKINNLFIPFFVFSIYVFGNVFFNIVYGNAEGFGHLAQPIMFILWTFCMFMLVPAVFDTVQKIQKFLRVVVVILFLLVLFSSVWAYLNGYVSFSLYGGSRGGAARYSFVYLNPAYIGGVAYSILCGSLLLNALSNSQFEKKLMMIFAITSVVVMYMASSRTYMLGSVVLFMVYFSKNGKYSHWVIKFSLLFGVYLLLYFMWKILVSDDFLRLINAISSNRLHMWTNYWYSLVGDEINWKYFFGVGVYTPDWLQSISLDGGSVEKEFTRLAIDNVYAEVFIMNGFFGFGLFSWALLRLYRAGNIFYLIRKLTIDEKYWRMYTLAIGALYGIIVGAIFTSHFPSVGNTINSIVFVVSIAIIFVVNRYVKKESNVSINF